MRAIVLGSVILLAACDGGSSSNANHGDAGGGADGGGATGMTSGAGSSASGASTAGQSGGSTGENGGNGGSAASTGAVGNVPSVGGCPVFTAEDAWNTPIDKASVNTDYTTRLTKYLAAQGNPKLHPDFGANWNGKPFGIPITIVPMTQATTPISFQYDDESDPGPYPFPGPDGVKIEGGDPRAKSGDRHIIAVQQGTCMAYEAWACSYGTQWSCGSGAKFDLNKNSYGQRPKGYTSADAAGLSILAGLVRYEEAQAGEIKHAIRFTLDCTVNSFTKPASHQAVPGSCNATDPNGMPMGVRVRLKSSYDTSTLKGAAAVVAKAMKTYGMILADNGSDFYFQGEPDTRWSDDDLNGLKNIPSTAFEVVDPVMPER